MCEFEANVLNKIHATDRAQSTTVAATVAMLLATGMYAQQTAAAEAAAGTEAADD